MVTRIFLALLGIFVLAAIPSQAGSEQENLGAAAKQLGSYTDGFYLDHKPGAEAALDDFRKAAQRWVVAYLNAHPKAAPSALKEVASAIDREVDFSFTPLAPDLLAVSASYGELGNVFLIGGTQHVILWDIRQAGDHGWAAKAAFGDNNRALSGDVHRLPPDAAGHIRFYVDGGYAQPAGATRGAQISIWSWDGKAAKAVFRDDYISVADDLPVVEVLGDRIVLHPKKQYRMLFACGSCSGRKLTWTLKLTGDGVTDMGKRPDIPEADVVDEVFFRLWQGKTASALAAPSVVQQMAAIVAEAKKRNSDPKFPNIGMLMGASANRTGALTQLLLATDNATAPEMDFSVLHRKTGYYLSRLEIPPQK